MSDQPPSRQSPLLPLALLAGGGAAAWFFWISPELRKRAAAEELARQIAEQQARAGGSPQSALQQLGTAACQAVALKYGLPPSATAGVCKLGVSLAPKALMEAAKIQGKALKAIGTGAGAGLKAGASGVKSVAITAAKLPAQIINEAAIKPLKSAGKATKKFFQKLF